MQRRRGQNFPPADSVPTVSTWPRRCLAIFFLIRLTCKNSPPFPGQLLSNSDGFFLDFRESVESRQIFVCLKAALGNDDAICFISAVLIGCQRQPLVCECVSVCVSVCVCVKHVASSVFSLFLKYFPYQTSVSVSLCVSGTFSKRISINCVADFKKNLETKKENRQVKIIANRFVIQNTETPNPR